MEGRDDLFTKKLDRPHCVLVLHGAFVSDDEVNQVSKELQLESEPIFIDEITSGAVDDIPKNILNPFKNLNKLYNEVKEDEKVSEWMLKTYKK